MADSLGGLCRQDESSGHAQLCSCGFCCVCRTGRFTLVVGETDAPRTANMLMLAPLLAPLLLALHPAAYLQQSSLSVSRCGQPQPVLQPANRVRRVSSAPTMATPAELIELGVSADTFLPQFAWLLIVALPRAKITERIMGPIGTLLALSLIHLGIVLLAATAPGGTEPVLIFADVFDPAQSQLDGMVRLFQVRDFVAEEWPHVLVWDLFVGRAIWYGVCLATRMASGMGLRIGMSMGVRMGMSMDMSTRGPVAQAGVSLPGCPYP